MSSIANLGPAPAALPQVNLHPHGHKKGSHVQATDLTSSDTTPQLPVRAAQNMFGNILQSLEQAIGLQLTPAPAAPAAIPQLQNYLNNAPHLPADASRLQNLAVSKVSINA